MIRNPVVLTLALRVKAHPETPPPVHRGRSFQTCYQGTGGDIDPAIRHGKPCIRGLRYPVELILELLSSGMKEEEIRADYPDLEHEDILAALAYAARLSQVKRVQDLVA